MTGKLTIGKVTVLLSRAEIRDIIAALAMSLDNVDSDTREEMLGLVTRLRRALQTEEPQR